MNLTELIGLLHCLPLYRNTANLLTDSRDSEISSVAQDSIKTANSPKANARVSFNELPRARTTSLDAINSPISFQEGNVEFRSISHSPDGRTTPYSPLSIQAKKTSPYGEIRTLIQTNLYDQLRRVPSAQIAQSIRENSMTVNTFVEKLLSEHKIPCLIQPQDADYSEVFSSLHKIKELKQSNYSVPLQNAEKVYEHFQALIQEQIRASLLAELAGMASFILQNKDKLEDLKNLQAKLLLDDFLLAMLPFTTEEGARDLLALKDSKGADEIYSHVLTACQKTLLSKVENLPTIKKKNLRLFGLLKSTNEDREGESADCKIQRFKYLQSLFCDASGNIQKEFKKSFEGSESRAYLALLRDPKKSAPSPIGSKIH
jgi:hypothetical protein